jgi:quercetin dioxygenase-like cupin family protein
METVKNAVNGDGFLVKHYGSPEVWAAFALPHPRFGTIPGKQFLRSELGLTAMEVSLNSLAPGQGVPFLHGHRQNEELYLFLSGNGQMLLDDRVIDVRPGSAVRIAPKVLRSWRNVGAEQLVCIVIQAKEGSLLQATAADGFISDTSPAWPA